ncbi:MAG: replicative DNA helicase [Bacteroidales bacterium]|nr:replicative DNA helicase [Bacteroidales bacterium]MBN2762765.1 replicative DNA helicase [Bacteroidales bacterium]
MAQKSNSQTPSKISTLNLELGKIPPQAVDLEEAVLGAVMLEKDAILEIIDILTPDSFYKEEHQKIFQAVINLSSSNKAIDILTVTEELKKNKVLEEVGGPLYITQLTSRVASAAHIEYHARIVAQKHIQRELIRVSSEIQNKAFDDSIDVNDLLDFSEAELFNIAQGNIKKESQKINVLIKEAIFQIEEASKRADSLIGIPSGYTRLDRLTNGWQKSDLVIIAARPSMGKTAFVLSMARNMAIDHNRSVAIFSLEMASLQLVNRLIVAETELPSHRIRNGKLADFEWEQLDYKIKRLVEAPIYIDDTPAISIFELRAKCRRLKRQHNVEVIIIDYLQLMTGTVDTRGNREQEVSTISRALKGIAKELDIPIIALSQLNRAVEIRAGNKRPQLSDLRESGAIEQDADMVLFIHRPEVYGFTEDENGNSNRGMAEIILAKHRNGPIGDIQLKFMKELAKFTDLEEGMLEPLVDDQIQSVAITKKSRMNENISGFGFNKDALSKGADYEDDIPF